MEVRKVRDLSLITIDEKQIMVIACDSCGGIGMKEGDVFKVPPFYVGKLTTRVALFEVLCSGAKIITIADTICNEMNNTGNEIIRGIKEELVNAGIKEIALTGSTEENFATTATGLGVTVVGIVDNKRLKVNTVKKEALIISIGMPKVGDEINLISDTEIVDYETIYRLQNLSFVYEIVPVGSKGIAYEAEQLAINNGMKLCIESQCNIDLKKSSGPATSVIAAINIEYLNEISKAIANVNVIGYLKNS